MNSSEIVYAIVVSAALIAIVVLVYALTARKLSKTRSFFEKLKNSLGGEPSGKESFFNAMSPLPTDSAFHLAGSRNGIGYRIELADGPGSSDGRNLRARISVELEGTPSFSLTYYGKPNMLEGMAKGIYGERLGEFFIKSDDMVWANGFFDRNEEKLKALSGLAVRIRIEKDALTFWPREENSDRAIEALNVAIDIVKRESKK
jgi:hypothetical protein